MSNYSETQKISDKQCLGTLIQKADTLPDNTDVTFKKMFESGKSIRV